MDRKILIGCLGLVLLSAITYQLSKSKILPVCNTSSLDKLSQRQLLQLFDLAQDRIQLCIYRGKMDERTVLTLYSLYKQVKEWNADEMPNAENETPKEKYQMWLQ